jgi:hypothetical protein
LLLKRATETTPAPSRAAARALVIDLIKEGVLIRPTSIAALKIYLVWNGTIVSPFRG